MEEQDSFEEDDASSIDYRLQGAYTCGTDIWMRDV
jgi:hypothetical protein